MLLSSIYQNRTTYARFINCMNKNSPVLQSSLIAADLWLHKCVVWLFPLVHLIPFLSAIAASKWLPLKNPCQGNAYLLALIQFCGR